MDREAASLLLIDPGLCRNAPLTGYNCLNRLALRKMISRRRTALSVCRCCTQQVCVACPGQIMPIWVHSTSLIALRVVSVEVLGGGAAAAACVRLTAETEVAVAPKPRRRRRSREGEESEEMSVPVFSRS